MIAKNQICQAATLAHRIADVRITLRRLEAEARDAKLFDDARLIAELSDKVSQLAYGLDQKARDAYVAARQATRGAVEGRSVKDAR